MSKQPTQEEQAIRQYFTGMVEESVSAGGNINFVPIAPYLLVKVLDRLEAIEALLSEMSVEPEEAAVEETQEPGDSLFLAREEGQ